MLEWLIVIAVCVAAPLTPPGRRLVKAMAKQGERALRDMGL